MAIIHDSSSVYNEGKLFGQHQAILTIIQSKLDNPNLDLFKWLDLGCGKGQMISQLESNLSVEARSKLSFYGFDIQNSSLQQAELAVAELGLHSSKFQVGDMDNFPLLYPIDNKFDFITLTNTIHEFHPNILAKILYETTVRLNDNGCLFIYDMEVLPEKELGATPWSKSEIAEIIEVLLNCIGVTTYKPRPGQWKHTTCSAWNINLQRNYFAIPTEDIVSKKVNILSEVNSKIRSILDRKYNTCKSALESITRFGTESPNEESEKIELLYSFWALSRVKEDM